MGSGLEMSDLFAIDHLANRRVVNAERLGYRLQRVSVRPVGEADQAVSLQRPGSGPGKQRLKGGTATCRTFVESRAIFATRRSSFA
jgi:hypothetical protein